MKTKKIKLNMVDFTKDLNVRTSAENYLFGESGSKEDKALYTSIVNAGGLVTPPALEEAFDEDGNSCYHILQGNRRLRALAYMQEHDETVFNKLFGDGFLANVYTDLTPEKRETIICDHSTVKRLTDFERLKTVAKFRGFGWKVKQISNTLGLPSPQIRNYLKVMDLQDADSDAIQSIAYAKQQEIAKEPDAMKVPWQALSACSNILAQAEKASETSPDDLIEIDSIRVDLDSPFKGMTAPEILANLKKPADTKRVVPTKDELKKQAESLPKRDIRRKVIEWVLGDREEFPG